MALLSDDAWVEDIRDRATTGEYIDDSDIRALAAHYQQLTRDLEAAREERDVLEANANVALRALHNRAHDLAEAKAEAENWRIRHGDVEAEFEVACNNATGYRRENERLTEALSNVLTGLANGKITAEYWAAIDNAKKLLAAKA